MSFLTHVFQSITDKIKTESMIRHRPKKTPTKTQLQGKQQNQPTKTKPLPTFLLELYKAWTETVKTATKGYYDISSLTRTHLPH